MKNWTHQETKPFLTGWRPAEVVKWYDGDTPKIRIDLGFGVDGYRGYVRLVSENALLTKSKKDDIIDTPELRGPERQDGLVARARVVELIPVGSIVRVWSYRGDGKRGKYGRYLVVMLFFHENKWRSIGDVLVAEGLAEDHL